MTRLPPLIALRAFEAVGRIGSVRAAADELGVSHTVVSRHVHNLEDRLQVRLLQPRGRGLVLTDEGARFHSEIVRAFDIVVQATIGLKDRARMRLEIWCVPGLASKCLLPQLDALRTLLCGGEIVLRPTLARPNLERGEADAEIIYLSEPDRREGRRADVLARPRVFPVASPAFCARYGSVDAVAQLLGLPLIHEESTEQWRRWMTAAGHAPPGSLAGPRVWHAHLATEAARLGQGIALTNEILTADELRSGALVEMVPSDVKLGDYHLVSLASRTHDPALRVLRHWLAGIFASTEAIGARAAPVAAN